MLPVTLNARLGEFVDHNPFTGLPLAAFVPLSDPQKEVWLASSMEPAANLAYNEGLKLSLRGALNHSALASALQTIVNRHESLRGIISPDGRCMGVLAELALSLPVDDLSQQPNPVAAVTAAEELEMRRPFNLETGPLVRFTLLKQEDALHHLLFVAHHIICDGWSSAVVLTELAALYTATVNGDSLTLYPPQRYGDYAVTEQAFLHSEEGQRHQAYWLNQLAKAPPTLDLPSSKARPKARGYGANRVDVLLPVELVGQLRKVGAAHNASLVATVLAGFATLLHKLTGTQDVIIGLAAAGQALHNQLKLVGHCVNLLPLRLHPQGELPFSSFLGQTRKVVLDAFDHQGTTFGSLLPKLELVRDESRPPLVNVLFNIDVRNDDIHHQGLAVSYETMVRRGENFELFINVVDNSKDLLLEASYNADLFTESDIRQRLEEFYTLLLALAEHPEHTLAQLAWIPPSLLAAAAAFNHTTAPLPSATVAQQISQIAQQYSQQIAVQTENSATSYATLEARSNAIAAQLATMGIAKGDFVGICMARHSDLVASQLATLKLGAVFLPLDPEFPAERLAYYLNDCGAKLLLVDAENASLLPTPVATLQVEQLAHSGSFTAPLLGANSPAYVIYTSGSTGAPKGVVASHGGFSNVLASWTQRLHLGPQDRMAAVASISFDMAIVDFWAPLVTGATLVLLSRDTARDGELLAAALAEQAVTVMQATPSSWRMLVKTNWPGSKHLRIVTGGEALARDLAQALLDRCGEVWNGYGPTETTVYSTLFKVTDALAPLLIGSPLANTQCHVLDTLRQPQPPGVAGELYIGGAGLALGYHQRPELNAERFIQHPSLGRLYQTGDLVRLTANGLEYHGRNDFQVKVRGYRIELGEIEYALSRHPAVADSTAQVREKAPGDARIVTWVATRPGAVVTVSDLRQSLRAFLPSYMLPAEFVLMTELPRLPNGKLNRAGLPNPFEQGRVSLAHRSPSTAAQLVLAQIWAQVLGLPESRIGLDDRFMELGGHSLLAADAAGKMRREFTQPFTLRALMMDPLQQLADSLGAVRITPPPSAANTAPHASAAADERKTPLDTLAETLPDTKTGWFNRLLGR